MTLPEGYRLKEFEIKQVLGKGGFGITYLAIDTNLKQAMVIKEFFPRDLVDREERSNSVSLQKIEEEYDEEKKRLYLRQYKHFLKKFEAEAQIMASIEHPNIVKVTRYFEDNNTGYFVMNYIQGESLKKYIKRVGGLNQEQIMEVIIPILEGLKAVHIANFLHRDIAPDNIFLTKRGKPMLLDFGAAKNRLMDDGGSEITIGVVKKGYSAPEQYSDDSIHTVSTDIYSVGAVIVFMISEEIPPEATKRLTLVATEKDPLEVILESYSTHFTQGFIKAILRAMNLNEKIRFQDIGEFQKALITERISLKSHILRSKKRLNQTEILTIVNPLLNKIEELHTQNKIHGNISTETVYIKGENIIELGRPMEVISNSSKSLTAIRNIGYSAPEQYSMDSKDTKPTDIYSVGAVIFFMITTDVPTEATKRQTEIYNNKEDSIKKILNGYRDRYSDEFLKTIIKAMKLNANDRFQDIMLFREALNKKGSTPPPPKFPKKIVLLGLSLVVIAVGIVAYSIFGKKEFPKPPILIEKNDTQAKEKLKTKVEETSNSIEKKTSTKKDDNGTTQEIDKCSDSDAILGLCEKNKKEKK